MKRAFIGLYALQLYLPFSGMSRWLRGFSRKLRGRPSALNPDSRLPGISWRACFPRRLPEIWEAQQANGNIRISELAILAALADNADAGTDLFEIGTFDGRTTLNLAMHCPRDCRIFTLDLSPESQPAYALADGEEELVEKPKPGTRYEQYRTAYPEVIGKIHQLLGDSAAYNFSPYQGRCSLVFVDGSHSYENALSDSYAALKMIRPPGVILWHDYGIWEGVTRALEEFESKEHLGLRHIRGTSLVYLHL